MLRDILKEASLVPWGGKISAMTTEEHGANNLFSFSRNGQEESRVGGGRKRNLGAVVGGTLLITKKRKKTRKSVGAGGSGKCLTC